jgi:putative endonuclease
MDSRPALGRAGEDAAAAFYVRKGFTVVERNWRCSAGEIDLIVRRGSLLVFCEVKTRSSVTRGLPSEAVDRRKQARLRRLAGRWLAERRPRARDLRFDVVAVEGGPSGLRVAHIPNAF